MRGGKIRKRKQPKGGMETSGEENGKKIADDLKEETKRTCKDGARGTLKIEF